EFKLEAVRLIKDRGVSYVQASRDLGVHPSQLRDWVKKFADDPQHAFPGHGQMKPEQLEIARLKREVAKLKAERDILKKAAARPPDLGERPATAVAANVLNRTFEASAPNRKWIADFTYVWTTEGWLYVAVVIDLGTLTAADGRGLPLSGGGQPQQASCHSDESGGRSGRLPWSRSCKRGGLSRRSGVPQGHQPMESADWAAGYVTEVGYTFGYYRELSPGILRLASLAAGVAVPAGQPLRYLELGFGQGLSINVHAAAVPGTFWGTDFNPGQVAHARALAEASGSGAVLLDESFEDLAARADLPEFDIIALHGVWTWISDENRRYIVDLIRRKLRAGGLVYISYNCFPGWAPAEPLRHLMSLHSELAGSEVTGTIGKIDGALAFARNIADSGALYFRSN